MDEIERRTDNENNGTDAQNNRSLLPDNGALHECHCGGSGPKGRGEDEEAGGVRDDEGARVLAFPTERRDRKGRVEGLSRKAIEAELFEHRLDLKAFQQAYSAIQIRVQEVKDEGRILALVDWSGTSAVMGSLELSIHAMERVMDELTSILQRMDAGIIPNLDEDANGKT